MNLTKGQLAIVQSLTDIKPRRGKYIVLTSNELHNMDDKDFIALCKEVIPEEVELITAFCFHCSCAYATTSSYMYEMLRRSLRKKIQDSYVTIEIKRLRKKYPSYFKFEQYYT